MLLFLILLSCPLFLFLYNDNKISIRNFIVPLYYITLLIVFFLKNFNNLVVWFIFIIPILILVIYQIYIFFKSKNYISLNYILIYFLLFYSFYFFVITCEIHLKENMQLAMIYAGIINIFFYLLIALLHIIYIILKLFNNQTEINIINGILFMPLGFLILFCLSGVL